MGTPQLTFINTVNKTGGSKVHFVLPPTFGPFTFAAPDEPNSRPHGRFHSLQVTAVKQETADAIVVSLRVPRS